MKIPFLETGAILVITQSGERQIWNGTTKNPWQLNMLVINWLLAMKV
jgi:hypothetical protein